MTSLWKLILTSTLVRVQSVYPDRPGRRDVDLSNAVIERFHGESGILCKQPGGVQLFLEDAIRQDGFFYLELPINPRWMLVEAKDASGVIFWSSL